MSLKAFRKDKALWKARTNGLKHPADSRDRQQGRKEVREMKKLTHRQIRNESKRFIQEKI